MCEYKSEASYDDLVISVSRICMYSTINVYAFIL